MSAQVRALNGGFGVLGDASNRLFVSGLLARGVRRAQTHPVKLFVVFRHAPNRLFVSRLMCWLPLLPFGLSSPVSEKVQSS